MQFVKDENDDYILDEYGDKIKFNVSYIDASDWVYKHREPLHINNDGNIDTENRNIITKDATDVDHVVTLRQLQNAISSAIDIIKSQITIDSKSLEMNIMKNIMTFRDDQVRNRIQQKRLVIPKTPHQFIKLFDYRDVDDGNAVSDLQEVVVLNTYIKRFDRYHDARSSLIEAGFSNSLEFFFNAEMTACYTYFSSYQNSWDMSCIVQLARIPQPILNDNENISESKLVPESNE